MVIIKYYQIIELLNYNKVMGLIKPSNDIQL